MLKVLSIDSNKEWDDIVRSFSDYDVYYLSGYVKAFRIHGDGEPLLFYYEDSDVRGINVVMKRDIAQNNIFAGKLENNQFFDFATPYGYGGWLIEGENPSSLLAEYEKWCLSHGVVAEFVRFHPVLKNYLPMERYYKVVPLGETVTIDTSDKELIWKNFDSKNRNVIRKALSRGVTIKQGNSSDLFATFMQIYNETMKKDNADRYYYFDSSFYESVRTDLVDNATVFYAMLDSTIIAASIILYANGRLNYHLSGSVKEYQSCAPTNLLLWKAAEWGSENGCKTFHLGGGVGSKEDGLLRFKKAFFRGVLCRYHIGQKVFDKDTYDTLVRMTHTEDCAFFPKYRGKK